MEPICIQPYVSKRWSLMGVIVVLQMIVMIRYERTYGPGGDGSYTYA